MLEMLSESSCAQLYTLWTQQLPRLLAVAKRLTGFKLCATTPNNTQQAVQTDATCHIQQCWESLANNVAFV